MAAPHSETSLRLVAAAKLLMDASIGNSISVVDAVYAVRLQLDRALDSEAGALEVPRAEGGRS